MVGTQVNLAEAKTNVSASVDCAAKGEDQHDLPFGQNLLGIEFLSEDWEKDIPLEYFHDEGEENPFGE